MTLTAARPAERTGQSGNRLQETEGPASRLKIAFVHDGLYPYFKGGAERRFYETARRLAMKHDVTYVTWQYWDGPPVSDDAGIRLQGVGKARPFYGEDGKRTISEAIAFLRRAAPFLLRGRFDVIDCCATPLLAVYLSWLTSRLQRQPLVVTWHEFWGEYWLRYLEQRPVVARIARAIEAGCVSKADSIVAVSEFTATKLRDRTGSVPVRVVENGVSLLDIDNAPASGSAPDILFAGRLIDDKRVDLLIKAVARVAEKLPEVQCAILGEGPERVSLEALVRELGLEERVRFLGFVSESELYGTMKASKVFVLPSIREGFGLSVIEAQAAGAVPVVVRAPYNAAVALVRDGVDGVICEPNETSLADAVFDLLTDEPSRLRMAGAARAAAAMRDWSKVTERMESLYLDLANAGLRRAA
jgi:glycosyltransferase involved in cell wall biosynthesis